MSSLFFNASEVILHERESVLDCLLRHGYDIPNGCRAGACQACLMLSDNSNIPPAAQKGLKEAQKKLGYFLSCRCFPSEPMEVSLSPDVLERIPGVIKEKVILTPEIVAISIDADVDYRAGQYVTLWKNGTIPRSYSLASIQREDRFLRFHVKRYDNGLFSRWAYDAARIGDRVEVQGPFGECFYACAEPFQPLFLAGIGTGLAPLYGIVRDALSHGHQGDITLIIGARHSHRFYLVDELRQLAGKHRNFQVEFIAQVSHSDFFPTGDIYDYARNRLADLTGYKVFLCGADSFVRRMKKQCFMAGAGMKDISADSFLPFSPAT